jgi:hypothetical protein
MPEMNVQAPAASASNYQRTGQVPMLGFELGKNCFAYWSVSFDDDPIADLAGDEAYPVLEPGLPGLQLLRGYVTVLQLLPFITWGAGSLLPRVLGNYIQPLRMPPQCCLEWI